MSTNDFFERVVYIDAQTPTHEAEWNFTRAQCLSNHIVLNRFIPQQSIVTSTVVPPTFKPEALYELLGFYAVIQRAYLDRINRILLLSGRVKLAGNYEEMEARVLEELPRSWDMVYWGHTDAEWHAPQQKKQEEKLVHKVWRANGTFAFALNSSVYHLFLEETRVPLYSLNEHLRRISLVIDLYVAHPELAFLVDGRTKR